MNLRMKGRLMVSLMAIGLFITASASMSLATAGTNMTMAQWTEKMNGIPTPGIGCWTATYPNTTWVASSCSTATVGPFGAPEGTVITRVTSGESYPNLLPFFVAILGATVAASLMLLKFGRPTQSHSSTRI